MGLEWHRINSEETKKQKKTNNKKMEIEKMNANNVSLEEIKSLYDNGNRELVATMQNGEKQNLRLFVSSTGDLAYFGKGKHRWGYDVRDILPRIASVKAKGAKKDKSVVGSYIENLRKFKKAYTVNLHPNLWPEIRKGYTDLNVDDFEAYVNASEAEKKDHYDLYKLLCAYCKEKGIQDIVTENRYKTTTISGNAPKRYESTFSYQAALQNMKKHLDNKENFSYSWRSNYDVSVSGKLCDDGIYRAWFSLEYKGCGNGHYYLLINENQAIFAEDD